MSCEVDSIFKVAHIDIEVSGSDSVDTKPLTAGVVTLNMPVMYTGSDFGEFHGESQSASASAVLDAVEGSEGGGVFEDKEGVSPL
jgi:formaldehyde-activating enzyme involved in methanogenesis